jgi:PEP-CTERM motif
MLFRDLDSGVKPFYRPVPCLRWLYMNRLIQWIGQRQFWLCILLSGALGPGLAFADTYTIFIKNGNQILSPQSCVVGTFDFNKGAAGTSAATNETVNVTANNCVGGLGTGSFDNGTLLVRVANVTSNNQDQGLNVVGIAGELRTTGGNQTRRFDFKDSTGAPSVPSGVVDVYNTSGPPTSLSYYVVNNQNLQVPEPGMLWLVGAALAGMFLVRRIRKPSA